MNIQAKVIQIQIRLNDKDAVISKLEMLDILLKLYDMNMTLDILGVTRIAATVQNLRKIRDPEIRDMAKHVILKWMQLLPPEEPEARRKIVITLDELTEAIGTRTL